MANVYIPILSYHRIVDGLASPLCIAPSVFEEQMEWLAQNRFRGVPLADAVAARAGRLSGQAGGAGGAGRDFRAFAVTFDHGYADNFKNAFPLLKELRIPAHFFLVTDLIDTKNLLDLPQGTNTDPERDRLMSWNEVADMKDAGMEIGAMTASHADVTTLAPAALADEIQRARDSIRGFLGGNPDYFSFPFGKISPPAKEAVKSAGFKGAVYTPTGKTGGMDRFSLRRVAVLGGDSDRAFQFKVSPQADTLRENPALFGIMKALGRAFE